MTYLEFIKTFEPLFRSDPFGQSFGRGRAGNFVRPRGDQIDVIWVQKHSSGTKCCVNLGIHYTFIPRAGSESAMVTVDSIEQPDCEIMMRLSEGPADDQWWPLTDASARAIVKFLADRAPGIFDRYSLSGEIASLRPEALATDSSELLSDLTRVRGALLLARIHERLGNIGQAVAFAKLGLEVAGVATGAKRCLREILKRHNAEMFGGG